MKNELIYKIKVEWDKKTGGVVKFNKRSELRIDMAEEFGGLGQDYCSDELFLTAISGCILETFLYIGQKMRIKLKDYTVEAQAIVDSNRSGFYISKIIFNFKIKVPKEQLKKAEECFNLSLDYCHLKRAINPKIEMIINKHITDS
jgi:organic hydroperoxide reductase OsmC/OhrA